MQKSFRLLLLLCAVQYLGGCQSWWPWEDEAESAEISEASADLERRATIQNNLDRGLLALQTDRLTMPKEDCAVFYYRNVLAVEPDNAEAQAGIDKVVGRYVQLAKRAHDNGNDKQAASWLKRAEEVRGPTRKTTALRSKIKESPKGQDDRAIEFLPATDYLLSREALDARGPEITKRLEEIAQRAESRQRAALVIARDQAEGDWIVRVMKEAVPGYALKTRIEPASRPAVILMTEKKLSDSGNLDSTKSGSKRLQDNKKLQKGMQRLENQKQSSAEKLGNEKSLDNKKIEALKRELKKEGVSSDVDLGAVQQ